MGLTELPSGIFRKTVKVTLICCLVLSTILGIGYVAFDPVVRTIILKNLVLTNSSENFVLWEDPPIDPHFKVFFFNLTNPEDVFNGLSKPKLQEVGPYTYHQKTLKQNITWYDNGTMSYKTRKVFTYSESLSCRGCHETTDRITTLNVPILAAYQQMHESQWHHQMYLKGYLYATDRKQWIIKSPSELIWGYDEPFLPWARTYVKIPPYDKFGFFVTKKSAVDQELPLYTLYTGVGNPDNLSQIALFNGQTQLSYWNSPECNEVRGSDGASFRPFIKAEDTLWVFADQLCRTIPLSFDKEISRQGLTAMRFKPRKDVFAPAEKYPSNECYEEPGRVAGQGVFDLSVCQFNTRIVLSWPHFLGADHKYRDEVEGMKPNETKHGFWLDVQPVTGVTMSAKARFQVNLAVNNLEEFGDLSKINDTVFPILWFEEGVDELGQDIVVMLKYATVTPQMYKNFILYTLIGLGSAETLLFIFALTTVKRTTVVMDLPRDHRPLIHGDHKLHHLKAFVNGEIIIPNIPSLYSDSSPDSSRATSTDHSRNSSESSNIPYFINMTNAAFIPDSETGELDVGPKCLLYPNAFVGISGPLKLPLAQECIEKEARNSS